MDKQNQFGQSSKAELVLQYKWTMLIHIGR